MNTRTGKCIYFLYYLCLSISSSHVMCMCLIFVYTSKQDECCGVNGGKI